ncbi:MAG: EamA family transporter [Gemmatimonadaceae bacterium]
MEVKAKRSRILAGFASVYVFWGSTYLFIRFAVETLPPIPMAGIRFAMAGAMLYLWTRWRGAEKPTAAMWRASIIVGALLMSSNASVAFAERRIPSGVASLLVAMTPVWMVSFDWWRGSGERPRAGVLVGLVAGIIGVGLLLGPGLTSGHGIDLLGAGVVLAGSVSWSFGSIYSRHSPRPASALLGSAMHMLCGGLVLTAFSLLTGQFAGFSLDQVSTRSWIGFVYLVIFGSLVGFSSFVFLLRATTPAKVATYAYVNPVVAVLLGWLFADEALTWRVGLAATVIVGAVAAITTFSGNSSRTKQADANSAEDEESGASRAMLEEVP